ncbi:hypothetical protein KCP78_25710 [Salmonella enterica subsp. enterica]|nr:hypothetical protein KCP78_25710 [Salmonella enterica subsp. enterica]
MVALNIPIRPCRLLPVKSQSYCRHQHHRLFCITAVVLRRHYSASF